MKRQLSLVLALVMILGTFTTVFAADTSADAITEASTFLKDKGVLVGSMTGDLMLDENLSRQDTAVLVARLMGELDVAQKFPTSEEDNIPTYEDIKDDFYLPVLAWAQANETFVGHSNARFGFDDNVTAQEYSKVLLVALGYKVGPNGDSDLTWEATLAKTKELGILDNINDDVKNTDEVTRGEMAVMTFNALSVMMKDGTQTLAEKLGIVMPAASKLTAEVKDTMNLKEVVINLSNAKLADADRLADVANYKVDGMNIEKVTVDGNDVILELENALVKGREYKLTVRNVETGVNGTYNFKAADNTIPAVEEVTVLGEYGIKVTTSEPIRDAKERNFLVDGKNVSMQVENYGRDLILTPYYNESFPSNAKTLTIKEIEDYSGLKAVEKDFDIEIVRDDVAPKVTDVVSRGNKVEVTFDKDIYEKSVSAYGGRTSLGNISYQSGRQTVYADKAEKTDTNVVTYTFDKEMPRRTSVTIKGIQNHSKVAMASVTQEPREVLDYSEPEIIEKNTTTTTTTATIELKFNKDVEGIFIDKDNVKKGFEIKNHFTLYERDINRGQEVDGKIKSAKYDVDSKGDVVKDVIIVELEGLTTYTKANDLNYVLEVENFTDATSLRNKMYRDYVDFKAQAQSVFFIENVKVYEDRNETEISINFSKTLDKAVAEEFTNYLFTNSRGVIKDIRDLKGNTYLENDGKTVTITLPEDTFRKANFEKMSILRTLKDRDGNRLANEMEYFFAEDVLVVAGQDPATAVDKAVAKKATDLIKALPAAADVTTADKDQIEAARKAYNNLTATQRALVLQADLDKLVAVETALDVVEDNAADLAKATPVINMIKALPRIADLTLANKAAVESANTAYNALNATQKALVEVDETTKLTSAVNKINTLEAARISGLIASIPSPATLADRTAVAAARAAYDDANTATQALVTNEADLVTRESEITAAEAAALAAAKTELQDDIDDAQAIHDAAVEGNATGEYPVGSKALLQGAIDSAQSIHNSASATIESVEQGQTDLATALAAFQAKEI